jgi:hypothetical protein
VTPPLYNTFMPIIRYPRPTHRACAWCADEFPIVQRAGRPRLYCDHSCRQRAYEHRHGFEHERTVRGLPGQAVGETWSGTGYERSMPTAQVRGRLHAMRTSVRPEGRRRETLCGVMALPVAGGHFSPLRSDACRTCASIVESNPLRIGITPSNELARLRALLDEARERRIDPADLILWIAANDPRAA